MQFFDPLAIICILIALSVHEWAHAFTAHKLGDPTPESMGRLTLNPLSHLDPLGAILFVIAGFGWAKPVPVNPLYFKNRRLGMVMTALAGPLSNFIMALACKIILTVWTGEHSLISLFGILPTSGSVATLFALRFLNYFFIINLALMAFNCIPIPPLDGSRIVEAVVPSRMLGRYMDFAQQGPYLIFAILLAERFLNVSFLSPVIMGIMTGAEFVMTLFIHPFTTLL